MLLSDRLGFRRWNGQIVDNRLERFQITSATCSTSLQIGEKVLRLLSRLLALDGEGAHSDEPDGFSYLFNVVQISAHKLENIVDEFHVLFNAQQTTKMIVFLPG